MKPLDEGTAALETEKQVEEVLERLWTLREQDVPARPDLAGESFGFEAGLPSVATAWS